MSALCYSPGMPRTARIDIPNLLQHVMVREIERRDIFTSDDDRQDFVTRFSGLLESTGTECLAWALLSNQGKDEGVRSTI